MLYYSVNANTRNMYKFHEHKLHQVCSICDLDGYTDYYQSTEDKNLYEIRCKCCGACESMDLNGEITT